MDSRFATNLLLAVIAGVLLFGRDAVMGGFQNLAILAAVIGVLFVIFWIVWWPIRSFLEELREAKRVSEKAMTIAGAGFLLCLFVLLSYAALLWLDGTENPLRAAIDSPLGTVWIYVLVCGLVMIVANALYAQLSDGRWRRAPAAVRYAAKWYFTVLLAIIFMPWDTWDFHREKGSGLMKQVFATAYGCIVGTVLSLLAIGATAGVLYAMSKTLFAD